MDGVKSSNSDSHAHGTPKPSEHLQQSNDSASLLDESQTSLCATSDATPHPTATPVVRPKTDRPLKTSGLDQLDDQELLEGIQAGSELYFGELYNRYFQRIYNFVYARLRNHADAEEVVQETFIAVHKSFVSYKGQSSLLSWIYGVAKNTTNSMLRRSMTQQTRLEEADQEQLQPRPSFSAGTPDQLLDFQRYRDRIQEEFAELADWQTEIFVMRHLENYSIPEISRRTSRSSDAVRSSLYRVKKLLYEAAGNSEAAAKSGGLRE